MSTNFFVVQAQRDLLDAQISELRAALNYQKALVAFERVQQTGGRLIRARRGPAMTVEARTTRRLAGPAVCTVFEEEGWKGLKSGLHHEAPKSQSGD